MDGMRETSKSVPIKGRNFVVESFEPLQGNCIFLRALKILPAMGFGGIMGLENTPSSSLPSDEELISFQKTCLKYCFEELPAGKTCILDADGGWAVVGLEKDMMTVTTLLLAVISFNFQSFFDENPLNSMMEGLSLTK